MKKTLTVFTISLVIMLSAQPGFSKGPSYEEIDVSHGGSIVGQVLFSGDVPPPILEDLNKGKNSEFCRTHPQTDTNGIRPRQKVTVDNGKLQDAVVFIESIDRGKPWSKEAINFEFSSCDVFPKIQVIRKPIAKDETVLTIVNEDDNILHNPHGYSVDGANRKTLFNKPLPSKGSSADVSTSFNRLKEQKDSHFFLQCDQHNFMEADARIVWNPYYSLSAKDGGFKIDNIPPGKYKLTAWHPYIGEVSQEVTVTAGSEAKTDFSLSSK